MRCLLHDSLPDPGVRNHAWSCGRGGRDLPTAGEERRTGPGAPTSLSPALTLPRARQPLDGCCWIQAALPLPWDICQEPAVPEPAWADVL